MNPRFRTITDHPIRNGVEYEIFWLYDKHACKVQKNPETNTGWFATDADAERFADTLPPVVRATCWKEHPLPAGFRRWYEYSKAGEEIDPFFISMQPARYQNGSPPYEVCESGASPKGGAERRGAFGKLRDAQKFASGKNAEHNGYLVRKETP